MIDFFEKGTFPNKEKKKNQKRKELKNFWNMLRMNQRILTMI